MNAEDPVHAAIPRGRAAGLTAAGTAVTAADLHRPVPCRQGTRGARRDTRPAYRAAACLPGRWLPDPQGIDPAGGSLRAGRLPERMNEQVVEQLAEAILRLL